MTGKILFKPKGDFVLPRHRFSGPYTPLHLQLDSKDNPLPGNELHRESLVEVSRLIVETVELNIVREAVLLTKHNVRSAINITILLVAVELALVR